jgi:hypothetical protein
VERLLEAEKVLADSASGVLDLAEALSREAQELASFPPLADRADLTVRTRMDEFRRAADSISTGLFEKSSFHDLCGQRLAKVRETLLAVGELLRDVKAALDIPRPPARRPGQPRPGGSSRPPRPGGAARPDRPYRPARPSWTEDGDGSDRPGRAPYKSEDGEDAPSRATSESTDASDASSRATSESTDGPRDKPYKSEDGSDAPRRATSDYTDGTDAPRRKPYKSEDDSDVPRRKPYKPWDADDADEAGRKDFRPRPFKPAGKSGPFKPGTKAGTFRPGTKDKPFRSKKAPSDASAGPEARPAGKDAKPSSGGLSGPSANGMSQADIERLLEELTKGE